MRLGATQTPELWKLRDNTIMYGLHEDVPVVLEEADEVVEERAEGDADEREGGVRECEEPMHKVAERVQGDEGGRVG